MTVTIDGILAQGLRETLDYIATLEARLSGLSNQQQQIEELQQLIAEKDKSIQDLTQQLSEVNSQIAELLSSPSLVPPSSSDDS